MVLEAMDALAVNGLVSFKAKDCRWPMNRKAEIIATKKYILPTTIGLARFPQPSSPRW